MRCTQCPQAVLCRSPSLARGWFRNARDIARLLPRLLRHCSNPDLARLGLSELMVNAVEHGNLALSHADKTAALAAGTWAQQITARLADRDLGERRAHIALFSTQQSLRILICDEGAGFDWQPFLTLSAARETQAHGRGIALARLLSFSALEYLGDGSVALATLAEAAPVPCAQAA